MSGRPQARYDAVVVGAGPAGTATALQLARAGMSTLVIRRPCPTGPRIGESLPPSVTPLLTRLGVLTDFLETGPLTCHGNRSSWGGAGDLMAYDFIREPSGNGWHIDRARFDRMMRRAACDAGVRFLISSERLSVRREDRSWCLRFSKRDPGSALPDMLSRAEVLVDATGRVAALARQLGVHRRHTDRLVTVFAFLQPAAAGDPDTTTLVEATPCGWWYSAPQPFGALVAAFTTAPDLLVAHGLRTAPGFLAKLAESEHTAARLSRYGYRLTRAPQLAAAGSSALERAAGDGWLAVGDAAAAHDPLSSYGIGSALSGALRAAAAIQARTARSTEAFAAYAGQSSHAYDRYLHLRSAYYAEETRWPDAPFWRRLRPRP